MFNAVWQEEEVVEEGGMEELLRYVGGGQGGKEVRTEQDIDADSSDQYSPGTTLRRTCIRMC